MKKALSLAFLICLICSVATTAGSQSNINQLFLLNHDWIMKIDLSDFKIERKNIDEENNRLEIFGTNDRTTLIASVFFEKAQNDGGADACREYHIKKLSAGQFTRKNEKRFEKNGIPCYEYIIEEYKGIKINQKNIFGYLATKDTWIDFHLSKVNYAPGDDKLFEDIINTVSIAKKSSLDYFAHGSFFFNRKDYAEAAKLYERALSSENKKKTLDQDTWRVLVDNLGMAYGISGDLKNSKRVLSYGVSKDPEYPMFYYNLACAYAEENDLDNTLKNLELSIKFRKNMIKGETFPDPKKDGSFKKYLGNERFMKVLGK